LEPEVDFRVAIENRKLVELTYDGLPRRVIPTAYGMVKSTGNVAVRAYLVGGATHSAGSPWRLFLVAKMVNPVMLDEGFITNPPGYKKGDSGLNPIYAQL
jgi:hypothetical protein